MGVLVSISMVGAGGTLAQVAGSTTTGVAVAEMKEVAFLGRHDIAIPVDQIEERDGEIVLPGATKDIVKALPGFDYSKSAK
jgi:hypothetical protein